MYTGHVRHLTMDPSARVKKKGTFAGIIERIPYLQALGINMLELQPVYEFGELLPRPVSSMAYFAVPKNRSIIIKRTAGAMARASILHPRLLLPGERMREKSVRIW